MIQPINKKILIEQIKETTTKSGIVLSEDSVEKTSRKGIIKAVADGITDLKVGDTICFRAAIGKLDNFIFVHYDEVLGIVQ